MKWIHLKLLEGFHIECNINIKSWQKLAEHINFHSAIRLSFIQEFAKNILD